MLLFFLLFFFFLGLLMPLVLCFLDGDLRSGGIGGKLNGGAMVESWMGKL
jgi:hypothetical protein